MFKNNAAIVAALMVLQVIGCNAKFLSLFNVTFSERKFSEYHSGMNWTEYQDIEVIYGFMKELNNKFPKLTELTTIGKTYEGRDLKVLRISENPVEYKKVWIDGGAHAREWISPATVTYIMHQLLTNWQSQPEFVKKLTWYFLPIMNPDGYVYSRNVNRYWRKNRSPTSDPDCLGVDLNRNFDIAWATIGSTSVPCEDDYHGPSAGSELETQAVTKFLIQIKRNLVSYLTYHSFGQILIFPWLYQSETVGDASELQRVGDLTTKRINAKTGSSYSAKAGKDYTYLHAGGSADWSRTNLNPKYVYTIELRDKGTSGFELPPDEIIPTGQEGLIVVDTIAEAIGT